MPDDTESFFLNLAVQRGVATRELAQECVELVTRQPGGRGLLNLVVERARIPQDVARALHAEAVAMASRARGPDVQRWVSGAGNPATMAPGSSATIPAYRNGGTSPGPSPPGAFPTFGGGPPTGTGPGASAFGAPMPVPGGPQTGRMGSASYGSTGQPRTQADGHTPSSWGPGGPPSGGGGRTAQAFQAGMQFGRYRLESELGRGGMGVVWRARQVDLDRPVAVKMLLQGSFADDRRRQRFLAEAKAVARLSHPNIVAVHDVGEVDGVHYFTMDLVEGPSLAEALKSGPFELDKALKIAASIASGLEAAHRERLVHRDMKPANIILDPRGEPKITDFGIAKDLEAQGQTIEGEVLGTPAYMPPEQANGRKDLIDCRADVYALGAILYRMLTGTPPFDGATPYDVITKVLSQEPPPMKASGRTIPKAVEAIALKCLSKKREDRYPSAEAVREAIDKVQRGVETGVRPAVAPAVGGGPPGSRHVVVASIVAGLLLLAAAGVVVQGWREARKRDDELREKAEREAAADLAVQQQRREQETALKRAAAAQKATAALELRQTAPDRALADARQAALDAPDVPAVMSALGQLLLEVGKDPGGALDALDKALKLDPSSTPTRAARAHALLELDRPAAEIDKEVTELERQGPTGRALAAELRADQSLRRSEIAPAVGHMDDAIGNDPKNARLRQRYAAILLQARRYVLADQEATKALELDSRSAATLGVRAAARCELGRLREALRDCEDALRLDPNEPRARDLSRDVRARLLAQQQQQQPPQPPVAQRPVAPRPGHQPCEAVHLAVRAFFEAIQRKDGPEASRQLGLAMSLPDVPCAAALAERAQAWAFIHKFTEAEQDVQRLVRFKNAGEAETHELMAEMLLAGGQEKRPEVRQHLDAALALEPKRVTAFEARARLSEVSADLDAARRDWDAAVEAGGPQDHHTIHERGHFLQHQKQFAEALADMNTAIGLAPDVGHYLVARGDVEAEMGKKAEALADYQAALQKTLSPVEAQRTNARIAELQKAPP